MLLKRKKVREMLIKSSRKDFYSIIYNAKLTPIQTKIVKMRFIDDLKIFQISQRLYLSEARIKRMLATSYDAIHRMLGGKDNEIL